MAENNSCNSEVIYQTLKEDILRLALKPGQGLSEHELCERFSVSRTPIRNALQRLQSDGLMSVIPYKGSTVTLLDLEDIRQMIYMRASLESTVIRDFMDLCTPLLLERIRYQIRKQIVLLEGNFQAGQFYEMDSQMHRTWFQAIEKERLWQIIQRSEINYTRFRMLDIVVVKNFHDIVNEHQELFDIIERKAAAEVEPLMRKHLNGGIDRLGNRVKDELSHYFISHEENSKKKEA